LTGLKITFCGPNFELNDRLAHEVKELVYGSSMDIVVMQNAVRDVVEITKRPEFTGDDLDWINLWAACLRRMQLEGLGDTQVVVSTSCGVDQVALQAAWLAEQMGHRQNELVVADATGQNIYAEGQAMMNRSGAVLQVLLNSAEEEAVECWDFIYAVMPVIPPPNPNDAVAQYFDFLNTVPAFGGIVKLPDNEEAAKDALKNEVVKWKAKLNA